MEITDHFHGEDGHVIMPEPHTEAEAAVEAVEEVAAAEVQIAEIEAERDITLAKIAAKAEEVHDETEVEVLRAELRELRSLMDKLMPEPAPEAPVAVIEAPEIETAPEVVDESLPAPESFSEPQEDKPKRKNVGLGMW